MNLFNRLNRKISSVTRRLLDPAISPELVAATEETRKRWSFSRVHAKTTRPFKNSSYSYLAVAAKETTLNENFFVWCPKENKSIPSSDHFCDSFQVFSCFIRECCAVVAIVYAHGNRCARIHESDWTARRPCLRFEPVVFSGKICHICDHRKQ